MQTSWTKDAQNPISFSGAGCSFPSEVWKNGDHWNLLCYGFRYTTTDPSFHSWTRVEEQFAWLPNHCTYQPTDGSCELGGQWFSKLPNTIDGSPSPTSSARMLKKRGVSFCNDLKNANNTRILGRKTCILLLEPCILFTDPPYLAS